MKRLNLPLLTDTFLTALCAFLLFFTTMRFTTKSVIVGLVFGVLAALIFGAAGFIYISKIQQKRLILSRYEKEKNLLALHLSLSSKRYTLSLFSKAYKLETDGDILFSEDTIYYTKFSLAPLSQDDIAELIRFQTDKNKAVFCNEVSQDATSLADNFLIKLIKINDIFAKLKDERLLPEKYVFEGAKKANAFTKIKARFNRKLFSPLFFSGATLLLFSKFTFFPTYYIVTGSIVILLAVCSLIFGKRA